MEQDLRHDLVELVRDLETQARLLRDFGVEMVARRAPGAEPIAPAVDASTAPSPRPPEPISEPAPAQPGRSPAQAHMFAEPEKRRVSGSGSVAAVWRPNPLTEAQARAELDGLRKTLGDCTRCPLSRDRRQIVFGEGNPVARLALVGEGPGMEEDRTGRPFVGPAGQLLERILAAMGLERDQVYICNVVKCRPPQNRTPEDQEMRTCGQFLAKQLDIVHPRHILCLGGTAARYLLNTERPMGKLRGRFVDHPSGARIMPTYHPAYLLRNEAAKKPVWQDVQLVMAEMDQPVQEKG